MMPWTSARSRPSSWCWVSIPIRASRAWCSRHPRVATIRQDGGELTGRRGWAMVEARLGRTPFFGGRNLTTADIMMVYCLTTSRAFRGTPIDGHPNLKSYLGRIGERPAYQRAMAKAEPGMKPMLA